MMQRTKFVQKVGDGFVAVHHRDLHVHDNQIDGRRVFVGNEFECF